MPPDDPSKKPPAKKEPPAADPPADDAPDVGFSIKMVDNLEDAEMKAGMKAILTQNAAMAKDNAEMKAIIVKQQTEREVAKYDKQRAEKLATLEELRPALAKKHKDTKDLGTIQTAIDTAIDYEKGFPEYETEKEGEEGKVKKNYKAPPKIIK